MIKMDDLNHHKNLYAGRGIEWMVEASFIAAAAETGDRHGLLFKKSVEPGEIISYCSTLVRCGRTSITIHVDLISEETGEIKATGYTTFVTVVANTHDKRVHGIVLDETDNKEELEWRAEADSFFGR